MITVPSIRLQEPHRSPWTTCVRVGSLFALTLVGILAVPCSARVEATAASLTDQEMEQFLRTARIGKTEHLAVGVTGSQRAMLEDGTMTHDAHIQTVDIFKQSWETPRGVELNFHDSYRYNIAAYRLDRLIGLGMVPVSVERTVGGKKASVTWWVDEVQMMEATRVQKHIVPPDTAEWNDQMYQMRVFTQLISDSDLNQGNILITSGWQVWLVDFTRAFRTNKELPAPERLERIDRRVYEGLRRLNKSTLEAGLGDFLSEGEINALLARRDQIVGLFDINMREKGEAAVFCDRADH